MSQLVAIAIITISLDNSSSYLPIFHTIMHLNFPVQLTRHTSLISMLFCSLPLLFILNYLSGNFSTLLAFFLLLYMYYLFHFYILPSTSLLSVFCLTYPIYPENTGQIRLARSLGRPVHIHRNIPVKHWFNIFICLASPLQIWVSRLLPPRSTTRFLWLQSCLFCSSYSWVLHCLEIGLQRTIDSTIHRLGRTETGHPGPACLHSIPHPTYSMQLHNYLFISFCHRRSRTSVLLISFAICSNF